jgi:GAF domain-containing protein/HAMP domain-containing protein
MYVTSRQMLDRLTKRAKKQPFDADSEEGLAWRQTSSFARGYTIFALAMSFFLILPTFLVYMHVALGASTAQMVYVTLAAIAVGLGFAVLENLIVESLMGPAREDLLPKQFEAQLGNLRGFPLLTKILVTVIILLIVGVLLIAPIGYHQTITALSGKIDSHLILKSLQSQLIIVSIGVLLLGFILAYSVTHSISAPIRRMLKTFGKVENGDLTQRLKVTSADEVGKLTIHFNYLLAQLEGLQTSLEERVAFRTKQLNAALEVGRAATAFRNQDDLIAEVVNMITDRFGHDYTAIFLKDSTGLWAELKNATGAAGQALKQRGYKLVLGGKSVVSIAMTTGRAHIALDVGVEPVQFDNPLLPDTRSEIALPLMVGEQVVGALDIQSSQEAAFNEKDIDVLQGMANQLAIALENARLFQGTWKSLEELRNTPHTHIVEEWSETAREYEKNKSAAATPGTPASYSGTPALNVPLTLHLVEAVATQAALASENARLVQDAQQRAERERILSQVATRMRETLDIDTILRTAVQEIRQTFDLDQAEVRLQLTDQTKKTKRQRKS